MNARFWQGIPDVAARIKAYECAAARAKNFRMRCTDEKSINRRNGPDPARELHHPAEQMPLSALTPRTA